MDYETEIRMNALEAKLLALSRQLNQIAVKVGLPACPLDTTARSRLDDVTAAWDDK